MAAARYLSSRSCSQRSSGGTYAPSEKLELVLRRGVHWTSDLFGGCSRPDTRRIASAFCIERERERERERSGRQRSRSRENEAVRRRGREIQALTHRVDQTTPEHGSWRQPTSCPSTASLPIYLRTWTKLELLQHRPTKRRRTSSSVEHQRPVVDESNLNAPQAREICYHGLGVQMYLRLWSCWRGVYTMFKRVGMAEEEIFVGRNCLVVLPDAFVRTKRLEPRSLVSARTGGGLVPGSKNSLCQAFHVQNHYC